MADIKIGVGTVADIFFRLRDKVGGNLVDDYDWVDGSTAIEWATVRFFTTSSVEVTPYWQYDITNDALDATYIKHPDGTKGIYRMDRGEYAIRVNPTAALETDYGLGEYRLEVTYDVSGTTYTEAVSIYLVDAGDVDFGSEILTTIPVADVTNGITTSLDDVTLSGLLTEAADQIEGLLDSFGVNSNEFHTIPPLVKNAVIFYARALIFGRDLQSGYRVSSIKEGDKRVDFQTPRPYDDESIKWVDRAEKNVERYARRYGSRNRHRFAVKSRKRWDEVL